MRGWSKKKAEHEDAVVMTLFRQIWIWNSTSKYRWLKRHEFVIACGQAGIKLVSTISQTLERRKKSLGWMKTWDCEKTKQGEEADHNDDDDGFYIQTLLAMWRITGLEF